MLPKPSKDKALPNGRYVKHVDLVQKYDYSLPENSAKFQLDAKKALEKNVKRHSVQY